MTDTVTQEQPALEPETPAEPVRDEADDQPSEEEEAAEEGAHEPSEAPEQQGASQAEWEARFTKAERAFGTYTRKVSDVWGDDATDLIPFSISPSAPPGFINKHDAGRVPEEIQRAAFEFFGLAREQDYESDPETRECQTCKGKGKTKTGSHVAGRETRACPRCKGTGAEGLMAAPAASAENGQAEQGFTLADVAPTDVPEADNWGEPRILPDGRENPNFGRQPQYKVLVEPWGVTAQLTAQDAGV